MHIEFKKSIFTLQIFVFSIKNDFVSAKKRDFFYQKKQYVFTEEQFTLKGC